MNELIDKKAISLLISQLGFDMVTEVLEAFVPDARRNIDFLQTQWQKDQYQSLRIKSHSLKSSAANLGFVKLSTLAKALEEHCLNHEEHTFDSQHDDLASLSQLLEASIAELALMGISQRNL